jgi:hypothetical protein
MRAQEFVLFARYYQGEQLKEEKEDMRNAIKMQMYRETE